MNDRRLIEVSIDSCLRLPPHQGMPLFMKKKVWKRFCENVGHLILRYDGADGDPLLLTNYRKWWYFMLICFVRGLIFGTLAISIAPALSSNTVQLICGMCIVGIVMCVCISLIVCMRGMTSRSDVERAIYSDSVDDRAISVCSLDAHTMGHLTNSTWYPVRDRAVLVSSWLDTLSQLPLKSASTQHSKAWLSLGVMMMPLSLVATRYLMICLTAFA